MFPFKIGFVGLTHLGIVSAIAAAAKGFTVCVVQEDAKLVSELNRNILPIEEPGLNDLFADNRSNISFSDKFSDLKNCDIVYIAVDVPTDNTGKSDLEIVTKLINKTIDILNKDAFLVVLCQVPPGFTRQIKLPFDRLYYQVETLVFGRAVERATEPERIIVGSARPTQNIAPAFNAFLESFTCPILHMCYESAELAKISINMYLIASVSMANMMAEISSEVGADWMEIVPALKLDKRIGEFSYINPGLGISGGNLERDLTTVISLAKETGAQANIAKQYLTDSRYRKMWALRTLHKSGVLELPNPVLGLLGLAYKENTLSTKNSPAIELINYLPISTINVYDPVVKLEGADPNVPWEKLKPHSTAADVFKDADALLIMTPWPEFKTLDIDLLSKTMIGKTIIDPYRMIDSKKCKDLNINHYALGRSTILASTIKSTRT
jgi:UDPglucose 6-dehydrogenase